jgi:hypothetical protein
MVKIIVVLDSSYGSIKGCRPKVNYDNLLKFLTIHDHLSIPSDVINYSSTSLMQKSRTGPGFTYT